MLTPEQKEELNQRVLEIAKKYGWPKMLSSKEYQELWNDVLSGPSPYYFESRNAQ